VPLQGKRPENGREGGNNMTVTHATNSKIKYLIVAMAIVGSVAIGYAFKINKTSDKTTDRVNFYGRNQETVEITLLNFSHPWYGKPTHYGLELKEAWSLDHSFYDIKPIPENYTITCPISPYDLVIKYYVTYDDGENYRMILETVHKVATKEDTT
jgi:hypothetical protein